MNASLGTVVIDPESGEPSYTREVHPVPKGLSEGYEQDLVKHGFKWSPLKLYHRKFSRGPKAKPWRLTRDLLTRADHDSDAEQEAILIVTIKGTRSNQLVYNELVQEMNRLAWGAQDLQIRSRLRMKP